MQGGYGPLSKLSRKHRCLDRSVLIKKLSCHAQKFFTASTNFACIMQLKSIFFLLGVTASSPKPTKVLLSTIQYLTQRRAPSTAHTTLPQPHVSVQLCRSCQSRVQLAASILHAGNSTALPRRRDAAVSRWRLARDSHSAVRSTVCVAMHVGRPVLRSRQRTARDSHADSLAAYVDCQ